VNLDQYREHGHIEGEEGDAVDRQDQRSEETEFLETSDLTGGTDKKDEHLDGIVTDNGLAHLFHGIEDDLAVTGLPTGVPGPPSAGPGQDGGMGDGRGGGMGPGNGRGVGPGEGFNTGGGGPRLGGGNGAPATSVDQQPILLNNPQPRYTEEARKNKIQGTVMVRVLIGNDGQVKRVVVTRPLPDGLDEQAIQAAYQLRFKPAMKSGQPVSFWKPVAIEFNLR